MSRLFVRPVISGVNIALAGSGVNACPSFDRSQDGAVGIDELVAAVAAALTAGQ